MNELLYGKHCAVHLTRFQKQMFCSCYFSKEGCQVLVLLVMPELVIFYFSNKGKWNADPQVHILSHITTLDFTHAVLLLVITDSRKQIG